MKKTFRNILAVVLCMVMVVGMLPVRTMAASPSISKTSLTLCVGNKYTLKIKNTTKKVTWSSSKSSVASVSSKGLVTAKKYGTATIKAKVGTKTFKCKVLVDGYPSLEYSGLTMSVGSTAKIALVGANLKSAKSSKSSVVSVTSTSGNNVTVKAKKEGTAVITAYDVWGQKYQCNVTIEDSTSNSSSNSSSSSSSTIKYTNSISLPNLNITIKAPNKYNDKGYGDDWDDLSNGVLDDNAIAFTDAYNEAVHDNAQGMYWSGGDAYGFYLYGINSVPASEIIYQGDGTYKLIIGSHFGGGYASYLNSTDITKYCADAILCELATMSSTPKTVYKKIYDMLYGTTSYNFNTWYTAGDCKVNLSNDGYIGDDGLSLVFTIKKK